MSQEVYEQIPVNLRMLIDIQNIEPDTFDYSSDEIWVELKKESTKAYKKLKEREFIIRHDLQT
tara:strand:+ start:527 stop:715 length:189 start_codon:yes stop_codon:yes gene_type:complete